MHNVTGIRNLTRLRVGFSPLNEHRFRHNFDCLSPLCVCGIGNEDNEHFLLHCPLFDNARRDLFGQLRARGGYLVYFADGMCTSFRVSFSAIDSKAGYLFC